MDFGTRIRGVRKNRGLTQEELARRADMSLKSVYFLETGRSQDPHFSTLASIASALDVAVSELLGEPAAPLAQAPPSPQPADGGEERRAEHTLIRLWARWARSFHGRFVACFVGNLSESPDEAALKETGLRVGQFASEFFSMMEALRGSGASKVLRRYVDARLVRATAQGLAGAMTLEEASELLEHTPEDVVQAVQDIRAAQADILKNLTNAVHWGDGAGQDELARRAEQWAEESRTEGLVEA